MRAVALILSVGVLGCFPHNEKYRTYAKYSEGGLILAGIGVEAIASHHTGAMCDQAPGTIGYDASCHTSSTIYGSVGLAMILAGLTGFIATVSTAEEDAKPIPPPIDVKASEKPEVKLPPGVTPPAPPSGSADAPTTPAP